MKKEPLRMCVGCRERFPQKELLRLVASPEGVAIDRTGRMPGRGAYLCYRETCVIGAFKKKSLQRALRQALNESIWIEIDQAVKSANEREE